MTNYYERRSKNNVTIKIPYNWPLSFFSRMVMFKFYLWSFIWTRFIFEYSSKKLIYNPYSRHIMKIWLVTHCPIMQKLEATYYICQTRLRLEKTFFQSTVWCVWEYVCVSWRQVYRWVSKFKTSQTYLKGRQRIGVPRSASPAAIQILAAFYREQFLQF